MRTDIFIRTYNKDVQWLNYSLRSIQKFCTGFNKVVLCIPENQKYLVNHLRAEYIVTCPEYKNDYIGQQISKLLAHTYCKSEYILFTDSDCIFTKKTTPNDFFINKKPFILKTPYTKVGDAICWKEPTEAALSTIITHEYMRRLPLLYRRDTLDAIDKHFNGIEKYVIKQKSFSEFNLIGAYADIYENDKYTILDTDNCELPEMHLKQFYSHDGVDQYKETINNMLQ